VQLGGNVKVQEMYIYRNQKQGEGDGGGVVLEAESADESASGRESQPGVHVTVPIRSRLSWSGVYTHKQRPTS